MKFKELFEKKGDVVTFECDMDAIYDIDLPGKEGKDWEYDDAQMAKRDIGVIRVLNQKIVKDIEKAAKKAHVKIGKTVALK